MAVLPEKLGATVDPKQIANYIEYMRERLEWQSSVTAKKIAALEKRVKELEG